MRFAFVVPSRWGVPPPPVRLGFPDGRFRPDDPVSRAQAATYLAGALGLAGGGEAGFDDVVGDVHEGSIAALRAAGITVGCDAAGRRYCPGDPTRRDQMASFLARAFELVL